jgi:hypothetical protein
MKSPVNFSLIKTLQVVYERVLIVKQLVEVFERDKDLVGPGGSLSSSTATDINLL